jgi:hypothetical protein
MGSNEDPIYGWQLGSKISYCYVDEGVHMEIIRNLHQVYGCAVLLHFQGLLYKRKCIDGLGNIRGTG